MSYQPQPGPWQQQPYPPYPPRPPARGHGVRNGLLIGGGILAGLFVVLVVVVGLAIGPAPGPHHAGAAQTAPAAASSGAAIPFGRPARDGDFTFIVKSMTCGQSAAAEVRADGIGETVPASAIECIVTMSVTDDKSAAQTFYDSDQYAYDAHGRQFSADSNASLFLKGDQDGQQVNPGITITARVPFQFPRGARIVRLVLHDSAFSDGVTVRVAG